MNSIIIPEIESYLKFLSSNDNEIFCFTCMDHVSERLVPGYGKCFWTRAEVLAEFPLIYASRESEHGATLHVCLNQTNLTGRRKADIQACRVLCVDLDRVIERSEVSNLVEKYGAQLVVESSPGKFHLYWKVWAGIGLENWKIFQLGLAGLFDGDRNFDDITHNIRVPGVPRGTKEGLEFVPSIVWLAEEVLELDYDGVLERFPGVLDAYEVAVKAKDAAKRKVRDRAAGGRVRPKDLEAGARELGRNKTLYTAAVSWAMTQEASAITGEGLRGHCVELNALFSVPMDEWEVFKVADSARKDAEELHILKAQELVGKLSEVETEVEIELPHGGTVGVNGLGKIQSNDLFKYDFNTPSMREHKYTEKGLAERVVQRFSESLIKLNKTVVAFNEKELLWNIQEATNRRELAQMTEICAEDILHEPEFVRLHYQAATTARVEAKKRQAAEKMMSFRLHNQAMNTVLSSGNIPKGDAALFDAVPEYLYLLGGVLDMSSSTVRAANSKDYLLKRSKLLWSPEAKCPGWIKFLGEVFQNSNEPEAMVRFMQELFGYSLSGSIKEQKLFLHSGDGCNGKSKVLQALATIGGDYATYTDPDEMVKSKNGFTKNIERFGAKIEGRRIVLIDDIDVKTSWNEAFVKSVTSDQLRARGEYELSRLIVNRAKLHLALNVMPTPDSENYGLLRRMCVIPYNVRFSPSPKKSSEIDRMIRNEAEGILAWAVEGYQRFLNNDGLTYPQELEIAVEDYRHSHFKIETVLDELFDAPSKDNPGDWEFYVNIVEWINDHLAANGELRRITSQELGSALKRKGKIETGLKVNKETGKQQTAARLVLKFKKSELKFSKL